MAAGNRTPLVVALVLLACAIAVLVTAYGYRGGSGLFPRFVGWIFVGLTLAEVFLQLRALIKLPVSGNGGAAETAPPSGSTALREVRGFLWIAFFLVLMYLVGFMIAIAAYIFAFLYLSARRQLWQCAVFAASAAVFVYILFIQLLEYRLYPGILLGG